MSEVQTISDDQGALEEWRERPFVLAAMLAIAGLIVHFVSDYGLAQEPWRDALMAAFLFGSLAAAFTLSARDWKPLPSFPAWLRW